MKVNIQVQRLAKTLNKGHRPSAGAAIDKSALLNEPGGNGLMDDAKSLTHQVRSPFFIPGIFFRWIQP